MGWVVTGETLETEGQTEPHGGPHRGAGGQRMILAGPSSLAELTAGVPFGKPLGRSSWLWTEPRCEAAKTLKPADPHE